MKTQREVDEFNASVKFNKQGWPKNNHHFHLGTFHKSMIPGLEKRLSMKYDLQVFSCQVQDGDYFCIYTAPCQIGINKFAEIRAYIDGYKDAQY